MHRDPLHKACRAHANACEYAPTMAILMLVVAMREPGAWAAVLFIAATGARVLHAVGMLASPTLAAGHPLRLVGAAGTYLTGVGLVLAAVLSTWVS
ncbi:MAG: MAPEG family protein [Deltaproteobacteria bacterium]|nr:MAG: MAPEG family protein [Deltaproteobacteria bacterium]